MLYRIFTLSCYLGWCIYNQCLPACAPSLTILKVCSIFFFFSIDLFMCLDSNFQQQFVSVTWTCSLFMIISAYIYVAACSEFGLEIEIDFEAERMLVNWAIEIYYLELLLRRVNFHVEFFRIHIFRGRLGLLLGVLYWPLDCVLE